MTPLERCRIALQSLNSLLNEGDDLAARLVTITMDGRRAPAVRVLTRQGEPLAETITCVPRMTSEAGDGIAFMRAAGPLEATEVRAAAAEIRSLMTPKGRYAR
ncbi:hypothetical protein GCM10027589_17420 [Actinocorallia lasiicapitis]